MAEATQTKPAEHEPGWHTLQDRRAKIAANKPGHCLVGQCLTCGEEGRLWKNTPYCQDKCEVIKTLSGEDLARIPQGAVVPRCHRWSGLEKKSDPELWRMCEGTMYPYSPAYAEIVHRVLAGTCTKPPSWSKEVI